MNGWDIRARLPKITTLQVTTDHWLAGASKVTGNQSGGPTGGPISVKTGESGAITEKNDAHDKTRVVMATDVYSKAIEHPRQDSNN